jgi:uncharacterized membrane protein
MNVKKEILVPTIILLALDAIYLFTFKKMFADQVLQIQKTPMQVRIYSVISCYVALIFGLWYFIIRSRKSAFDAFVLGILIYAVYETTTFAIFKNWDIKLVILDTIWGGLLLSMTTFLTYKINSGHM